MEAICIVCKKPLLKKRTNSKLCSDECRKEHNRNERKKWRLNNRDKQLLSQKRNREKLKHDPEKKEKQLEAVRKWRRKSKEKIRSYFQKYQKKNKERLSELNKKYQPIRNEYKKTPHYRSTRNKSRHIKRRTDPIYYLIEILRGQLNKQLKRRTIKKKSRALELLGIEIKYFKKYMEHKFKPGMTWENRGTVWHIDHIIPLACLDLKREDVLKFAFNYRNMQPMFADDNLKKSADIFIPIEKGMKLRDVDYLVKNVLEKCRPDYEFDFQTKKDGVLLKYIKN